MDGGRDGSLGWWWAAEWQCLLGVRDRWNELPLMFSLRDFILRRSRLWCGKESREMDRGGKHGLDKGQGGVDKCVPPSLMVLLLVQDHRVGLQARGG